MNEEPEWKGWTHWIAQELEKTPSDEMLLCMRDMMNYRPELGTAENPSEHAPDCPNMLRLKELRERGEVGTVGYIEIDRVSRFDSDESWQASEALQKSTQSYKLPNG